MNRYIVVRTQNLKEHNELVEYTEQKGLFTKYLHNCGINHHMLLDRHHSVQKL
jgi:hypothetical protein